MNKTKLFVGALMGTMICATCLTSCIKDDESASVTAVRLAKANVLNAEAEADAINAAANKTLSEAQAQKAIAEANLLKAQIAVETAEAAYKDAETAYKKAQTAALEAQTDAQKKQTAYQESLRKIELEKAQAELDAQKSNLEVTKKANETMIAGYGVQLKNLELQLAQATEALRKYNEETLPDEQYKNAQEKITAAIKRYSHSLTKLAEYRSDMIKAEERLTKLQTGLQAWETFKDEKLAIDNDSINNVKTAISYLEEMKSLTKTDLEIKLMTAEADLSLATSDYTNALNGYTEAKTNFSNVEATGYYDSGSENLIACAEAYKTLLKYNGGKYASFKEVPYSFNKVVYYSYCSYSVSESQQYAFNYDWSNELEKNGTYDRDTAAVNRAKEALELAQKAESDAKTAYDNDQTVVNYNEWQSAIKSREYAETTLKSKETAQTEDEAIHAIQEKCLATIQESSKAPDYTEYKTNLENAFTDVMNAEEAAEKALEKKNMLDEQYQMISELYNSTSISEAYNAMMLALNQKLAKKQAILKADEESITTQETAIANQQEVVNGINEQIIAQEKVVANDKAALDALLGTTSSEVIIEEKLLK